MNGDDEGPPPTKKQKVNHDLFLAASAWIQTNGGFVHPAVHMDPELRTLSTHACIPKDAILFSIPSSCTLTIAERDNTELTEMMHFASSYYKFDSPQPDVHLACAFATEFESKSTSFAPYFALLPPNTEHDSLLRRWSDSELDTLLPHSPLHQRALAQQEGMQSDHATICQLIMSSRQSSSHKPEYKQTCLLPSLASYDHALAVVTSRAFSGMSADGYDALVPLLDLLNHTRGSSSKNVGYKWNNVTNMVDVFTTVEVMENTLLQNTYGTKGNAQLLCLCLGFVFQIIVSQMVVVMILLYFCIFHYFNSRK